VVSSGDAGLKSPIWKYFTTTEEIRPVYQDSVISHPIGIGGHRGSDRRLHPLPRCAPSASRYSSEACARCERRNGMSAPS